MLLDLTPNCCPAAAYTRQLNKFSYIPIMFIDQYQSILQSPCHTLTATESLSIIINSSYQLQTKHISLKRLRLRS